MPVVLRYKGFRFFFYLNEGSRVNRCMSMFLVRMVKSNTG